MDELKPPYDPNRVYEVPLKLILADQEFNCRGPIDPTNVVELANDIRQNQLTQPVLLQTWDKTPGKEFRLVAGYRRFTAHKLIPLPTIRSLIRQNVSDIEARILNLSENLQRENLNIKQEAHAIKPLIDAKMGRDEIGLKVGKSGGWVQVRMYLLDLPDEIQDDAAAGILTNANVRECWTLPTAKLQFEFVKKVKDQFFRRATASDSVKAQKARILNEKRTRGQEEIFAMQDAVRELVGNGIHTQLLGWTAGVVSDYDMHMNLAKFARTLGKTHDVPDELKDQPITV